MNKFLKKLRGLWRSRTALYALGISLLGYMQSTRGEFDALLAKLPDDLKVLVWPAVGVGMLVLRWLTTKPLEEKAP